MTTPQRALELAEIEEALADTYAAIGELDDQSACLERALVFRHYAEIMQAEAVGYFDSGQPFTYEHLHDVEFIIKPKPLP